MQKTLLSGKTVGTKLTPKEYQEIRLLVKNGIYLGISDFVRDAVREKLETMKVIKTREVDFGQVKKEVLSYYREIKEAFPSDAANDLELDLELVHKAVKELMEEGRLGETH